MKIIEIISEQKKDVIGIDDIPELRMAAKKLQSGEITKQEYQDLINNHKMVRPYTELPKLASKEDMEMALDADKIDKINKEIPDGTLVKLRLDIPAYTRKGVWVPTVHDKANKVMSHRGFAVINNASIECSEKACLNIANGSKNKAAFAKIVGYWENISEKDALSEAQSALNDPNWVQIGMDPKRHSFFYDRKTQEPIISAERIIQLGGLVLGYNPIYDDKDKYLYEFATMGATSSANIASVANPQIAIGKDLKNKSFTGSPGKSGTKSPKLPKIVSPKNSDGTVKNAADLKNTTLFGGKLLKR